MCGIAYSKSFVGKPVNRKIEKIYEAQRLRGTDGFGFYLPMEDRLTHNTREGRIRALLRRASSSEILFHHRLPTSTLNVRNSCHPFSTKDFFENNYVGVHNGVIWNDEELRKQQDERGIKYISEDEYGAFNDSEALVYDLASYIEGRTDRVEASGSIAFILIQKDKKGKTLATYFGRNHGNPLIMTHDKKHLTLSSEGKGTLIEPHKMYCFNHKTGIITSSPCYFPEGYTSTRTYVGGREISGRELSGYDGFGFGWERDDDDELREVMTAVERERYFRGELKDDGVRDSDFIFNERSRVKYIKDKFMYDAFENPFDAIESAEYELGKLKEREVALKEKVEVSGIASNAETDEYCEIADKIYYLEQAIEEIRRNITGSVQQGFHFTPDHSTPTKSGEISRDFPIPKTTGGEDELHQKLRRLEAESNRIKYESTNSNRGGTKT